jgi:hypothetical protein
MSLAPGNCQCVQGLGGGLAGFMMVECKWRSRGDWEERDCGTFFLLKELAGFLRRGHGEVGRGESAFIS